MVLVAGMSCAVALSGCSNLTPSAKKSSPPQSAAATRVPSDKVTITVSDFDNSQTMPMIIAAFKKQYPQVTVKHQYTAPADYQKTLKLVMQSASPPDIVQYNTPIRELASAGLILDLTPYEAAYGWDAKVSRSLLDQTRFTADGKTMGQGALLAAPSTVPLVGVYYNKQLTAQAGIESIPTTIDAFTADLAKVKARGTLPLQMGSLDFGGIHNWAAVLNSYSQTAPLRNWMFGASGSSIDTPAATQATATFGEWAKLGYYPPSANGTSDVDAAANFAAGKSAYLIDGSWQAGAFQKKLGANVGYYLLPMKNAGDPVIANASVAAYSVSAKTKSPAAAAAFLNFFYSQAAAPGITLLGNLSVNPALNGGFTGLAKDVADAFAKVAASNGSMIFPDQSAPALLDVLTANIQKVVAQKESPANFAATVQKTWAAYHN